MEIKKVKVKDEFVISHDFTKDKIYEVDDDGSDCYLVKDDNGIWCIVKKSVFEKVKPNNVKGEAVMYNETIKCIDDKMSSYVITGETYVIRNGKIISGKLLNPCEKVFTSFDSFCNNFIGVFSIVKSDKIRLLLQDKFEIINNNFRFRLYLENEINKYNELDICYLTNVGERIVHEIRWGKVYNTTLEDVKPLLDALNIEIVEEPPKYKLDIEGEYTEEQIKDMYFPNYISWKHKCPKNMIKELEYEITDFLKKLKEIDKNTLSDVEIELNMIRDENTRKHLEEYKILEENFK